MMCNRILKYRERNFNINILFRSFCCQPSYLRNARTPSESTSMDIQGKWIKPAGYETGIHIYNGLVKEKVPFIVKNRNIVNWYSCGPTVYDSTHIGHLCCYTRLDIIRRIMETYCNLHVIQVMCITDVDDKIIARSAMENIELRTLTKKYEAEFLKDLVVFNISPPNIIARVTDFIPDMINFIKTLLDKGYAYYSPDGSIYFDTQKYGRYGKFKHVVAFPEGQEHVLKYKKSLFDFVLWKAPKPNEPYWETIVGPGRPGWHIECSAMASKYFGSTIDVHSGGIDLLYPHHECEEAQSCVYHDTDQWVNYWIHSGHIHVSDGVKMSKSLGNALSVHDFLRTYTPSHLRMLCLLEPYFAFIEYSDMILNRAVKACNKFRCFFENCDSYITGIQKCTIDESLLLQKLEETKHSINKALLDNFDTPTVMDCIDNLMTEVNKMFRENTELQVGTCPTTLAAISGYIRNTMNNFGIVFEDTEIDSSCDLVKLRSVVDRAVSFRHEIRNHALTCISQENEVVKENGKKLLNSCDSFRKDLQLFEISIKDREDGSSWSFIEHSRRDEKNSK